jgi:poly-beta-1,6-N-acetyl-D-glucosamine biosynthesis protein PgaD
MVSDSIIIDSRSLISWKRRIFSDVSTAVLWGFWAWLWKPIAHFGVHFSVMALISMGIMIDDREIMIPMISICTLLTVWDYLSKTTTIPTVVKNSTYSEYFGIEEKVIQDCQQSQVCVVHHDEHGKIVNIEAR